MLNLFNNNGAVAVINETGKRYSVTFVEGEKEYYFTKDTLPEAVERATELGFKYVHA